MHFRQTTDFFNSGGLLLWTYALVVVRHDVIMTCLHCGKKLGFFSRYKDTPFCSEDHLRSHQDELERALMERLGSKAAVAPPEKVEKPVAKPVEKAIEKPVEREPEGAALHDRYFDIETKAKAGLNVQAPLVPQSAFAIIVQADCCTPASPDAEQRFEIEISAGEIELSFGGALVDVGLSDTLAADSEGFGDPWVMFPETSGAEIEFVRDINPEPDGDLTPLGYEAENALPAGGMLGQRHEVPVRPRNRYPYAASVVTSYSNALPLALETAYVDRAEDLGPVSPSSAGFDKGQEPVAEAPQADPLDTVMLSIAALLNMGLDAAPEQDYSDSLVVLARALETQTDLKTDSNASGWNARIALPVGITMRTAANRWKRRPENAHVTPLPFPSLFQLEPSLPPRPEVSR